MPHLTVEYSANLDGRADIGVLCDRLLQAVLSTRLFEVGAVRVRAFRSEHYAIADQLPENAFVDMNFRIGTGRTAEEKKRTGEAIFAAVDEDARTLVRDAAFRSVARDPRDRCGAELEEERHPPATSRQVTTPAARNDITLRE